MLDKERDRFKYLPRWGSVSVRETNVRRGKMDNHLFILENLPSSP